MPGRRLALVPLLLVCAATAAGAREYPKLLDSYDADFQAILAAARREHMGPAFWRYVEARRACIAVVDVTDLHKPRVAAWNPETMLYAASLPKIAIALGVVVEVGRGHMKMDEATEKKLTAVIRKSSNSAASELYYAVGPQNLADILMSDRFKLYDVDHGGGLWVGKGYDKEPVWKRDPLHGISHGANAIQAARFYYLAMTNQLATWDYLPALRQAFGNPGIRHKFVKGLFGRSVDDVAGIPCRTAASSSTGT